MIKYHDITDAFSGNSLTRVAQIGRIFIRDCDMPLADDAPTLALLAKVADWSRSRLVRVQQGRLLFAQWGLVCETCYNAAHGRAYDLCVYPPFNNPARRIVLAAQCGMSNTDPEIAKPLDN